MKFVEDHYSASDLQERWGCSETTLFSFVHDRGLQPSLPVFRIHYSNENAIAYLELPADQPNAHAGLRDALHESNKTNIKCEVDEIFGPEPRYDRIEKVFRPASTDWIATHSQSEIFARALFVESDVTKFERENGLVDSQRIENKQEIQCKVIVDALVELGFDPGRLPNTRGQAGAKRQVRDQVMTNKRLFTDNSFNKAWDRLRNDGRIKSSNVSTPPKWGK